MGETGLVPRVEEDGNNFKMFELMYATVSKDVWQPLIPVGSWGPPDVSYKKSGLIYPGYVVAGNTDPILKNQSCGSGFMVENSVADPNCLHPGSRILIKEFKYFNPKKSKKMLSKL
jgi:hypothetical protein